MTILATDSHEIVSNIMSRYGVRCTPEEFHAAVNVAFHEFESQVYDQIHANMWESLPLQFALLVDDCLRAYPNAPQKIRLLDIGAGTGLASHCLLQTPIGQRIVTIDLLDTSKSMLEQAISRSASWKVPVRSRLGLIDDLPAENLYDMIVTCSVLHHVPDLRAFFARIREHQAPGGIFLHLQDPNFELLDKADSEKTGGAVKKTLLEQVLRFTPRRIWARIIRQLAGIQGEDYVSKTNRALIEAGFITEPLKVADLYAITDIHVSNGKGIRFEAVQRWLPDYVCLSRRSYGFFGKLWSDLPPNLKAEEERLSRENNLDGNHVAAAWRLKVTSEEIRSV